MSRAATARQAALAEQQRQQRRRRVTLIGTTALAALAAGALLYSTRINTHVDLTSQPVLGRADAPHTLLIFGDLKCPACRSFEQQNAERLADARARGVINTVFMHYPFLARARNLNEDDSLVMAKAAECGYLTGGAERHETIVQGLYAQQQSEQDTWGSRARLPDLLTRAGLTAPQVQAVTTCVDSSSAAADAVKRDQAAARAAGLRGTPLLILDGKILTNLRDLDAALR